jgi:hypothetical protein
LNVVAAVLQERLPTVLHRREAGFRLAKALPVHVDTMIPHGDDRHKHSTSGRGRALAAFILSTIFATGNGVTTPTGNGVTTQLTQNDQKRPSFCGFDA